MKMNKIRKKIKGETESLKKKKKTFQADEICTLCVF